MKMIDIINKLIKEGYKVSFFKRKDGGVVITRINGKSYRQKAGNVRARELVGEKLSEELQRQRVKASEQSKTIRKARKKGKRVVDINQELESKLRRVQRIFRKNKVLGGGKPTKKKLRQMLKERGPEEAFKALDEAERYAKGLAYNENINDVIAKLKRYQNISETDLNDIIKKIDKNRELITEDMIFRVQYLMSSYANGEIKEEDFIFKLEDIFNF